MIFRYLSTLIFGAACLAVMSGCGGGGSASGSGNASGGGTVVVTVPSMVQAGIFSSQVNGQDFWGVITPATWGSRWYGLHYAASPALEDPDIFSGSLTGLPAESASIQGFKYFPLNAGYKDVFAGSGRLNSPSEGKLSGQLSFTSSPKFSKPNLDFTATQLTAYKQPATLNDIANAWVGRLSYGEGSNGAFTFNVSPISGAVANSAAFGLALDCKWTSSNSLVEPDLNSNIFKLTLSMSIGTACGFQGQTLTGVAFVQKSPVAGKTQRLIWVATTPDGQGMSFKADR
jgi:hypothetical protein